MEKNHDLLIIFYRNPEKGKVKTRLAHTIGDERALRVYHALAEHTRSITKHLELAKVVYYSDHILQNDMWDDTHAKAQQSGGDLGERMKNAFMEGFAAGHSSICIIGTDCYELTTSIVTDAFNLLKKYDAVIGPALDGGYYLLGLNALMPEVFDNKTWSTKTVYTNTIKDFQRLNVTHSTLPPLQDVDIEENLPSDWRHM